MSYKIADIRFGDIPPELYADIAADMARLIKSQQSGTTNSETQLRRFYDEICRWHQQVNHAPDRAEAYRKFAPLIKMIKAKAAYAHARNKQVDAKYVELLNHCINRVNSAETLAQCKLFFEAFSGFYKAASKNLLPENN